MSVPLVGQLPGVHEPPVMRQVPLGWQVLLSQSSLVAHARAWTAQVAAQSLASVADAVQ